MSAESRKYKEVYAEYLQDQIDSLTLQLKLASMASESYRKLKKHLTDGDITQAEYDLIKAEAGKESVDNLNSKGFNLSMASHNSDKIKYDKYTGEYTVIAEPPNSATDDSSDKVEDKKPHTLNDLMKIALTSPSPSKK